MFSASNDASLAPGVGVDYLTVAQGPLERSIALLTDKAMFQVRVLEEVKKEATGGRYTAALHFAEKEFAHSQELLKAIGEGTLGTRCAFEMPARTLIEYEWYCGWMDLQHQFARVAFKSQTHTLRTRSVTQIDEVKRVFETQLARQDAEKAALERNLQEVKATVAALVGEKANLESDLLASKRQFVSLQGLHADLVNQMATLEHESTEKIANLERDLLDSYNRMKSETTKVAALEQECANARTELSHHVSSLEETQHALQAEVTGLRRHLDDAQKQMEVERMEKASLKASLEKSEESHRSTTEALKARIDALTDEKTKVSEALETERDKGAQLQTTINDLQARIHTVSESEAGKDTAAEEENQQLLQLEKVLASEAAAHNTLQSIKEQRVAEEISARDAQTELHGQIEALQARIDALTDEKTKMSEALETERGKGAQLQTTINDLQAARPMNAQDPTTGVTNAMSVEELQAQFDTQLKKCQTEHQYSLSVKEYRFFVAGRLTHFKGLLTARQKVDRDDWTKWWNIAQRLVATTAVVDDVGGSDEFVIALESLEQLIAARCDAVKVDDSFFTGRQEDEKPHFHVMLDVAVLVDLLTGNDDKRATAARAAFNTSVTNLARAAEEMIKQNGESPLFRAVRNILTGSTKHPTGRQGFSFLAAASEIYTFLTELSKRSRATGLCDIDALVTVHIIDPFKAALQSRLPSPSSTPDVEAWAKAIVEAYEWVNDKRTKEGAIVQLGAKAAQFGQLLNAAIEFIFDPVKMRDIRAIRDAVWSIGNAEVLRLPPFQRLEGVDLRTIADHWDTPSAAKLTMTSSDGPTPREETIDAQQRLAARIDVVMTQANSVIDRFMLHELQTLASAEHVRVELRAAALKATDAAIANPRDVEAQLQLIAHAAAIATWCMTPTSGMRDLVKTSNPDEREKGLLLIPHRLQLVAVLRVFGLHTDGKADFLADALAGSKAAEARLSTFAHNHLLEVGTGQGKSLILGVIGIAVALVGVDVDVVCYNRLLSRRDRAGMVGFDCGVAGVDCGISYFLGDKAPRYLTFTELAKEISVVPRLQIESALTGGTTIQVNNLRKRLILVDEVDAFFEIAHEPYAAGFDLSLPSADWWHPIAELYRQLWLNPTIQPEVLAKHRQNILDRLPQWGEGGRVTKLIVEDLVEHAVRTAVSVVPDSSNAFGHTFKNDCEIGMVDESDYFDPNFRDTYIAPFLYWRETSRVGGALNEAKCGELKRSVHSLRVALPPVTYSWLLQHCYMGMIGLSGTLRTLPTALLDYMQQDHLVGPIKRWTFVPPVHLLQQRDGKCGIIPRDATVPWTRVHASQLLCASFKHATALYDHTRDCAPYVDQIMRSAKPEAEWSNLIAKSVRQHRDQTRAVVGGGQALVVFDDAARLAQFLASDAGAALAKDVGVDHLVTLDQGLSREQVDERVHNAMKPRTVTLMTRSYGRGTDFKAGKRDVVLVVQTFVSRTLSDEIQIRGRTARADRAGRYLLMFCPTHLAHLGVPDHAGAANAVVQADLTQGASDPSFVVLRKQRDDRVTEDMKLLQASLKRTVRSTKDFAKLHDPECPFLDQVAVLRDYNAGKSLQGKNITIDLVIDVSASMRNPLSTTEPLPRYIAMRNNLTALYNDVLHKLADVKWNLVVFGNKCFHCSGDNGQPYSFDDKTVTPHGVLEAHLNTKGFQMGTHFLPAAQQLADIIRRDTILTVESVNADGSTATSLVPPQHYVFWFTDGAPDDAITNIECNYDVALYAPCRALFAELRNRIAAFQVAIFAGADINAVKVDIVRTFSECWEGRTDKAVDARELKQTLEVFGETVRESVLR